MYCKKTLVDKKTWLTFIFLFVIYRLNKIAEQRFKFQKQELPGLSDKYRPAKLGMMFRDIYANEWESAFESLKQDGNRTTDAIETLFSTLTVYLIVFM